MALSGTLVKGTAINSDGDAFFEIFTHKPYIISNMCPRSIQGVDILDGEWGSVGSVIVWKYHHDGKDCCNKDVVEAIDREKKLVCFKVVEGTVLEHYKSFIFTIQVDTKGPKHFVTWTFTYEKRNENVHDEIPLMEFCLNFSKDIDNHQHKHHN